MDKWDIIVPHRLLINRSLKKASDDTKKSIAEYKAKFENELRKSEEEIAQAQEEINSKLKKAKQKLEEELKSNRLELDNIVNAVTLYVNNYLERARLYKVRELNNKKIELLNEKIQFLSEQLKTISEEIDILKVRQEELVSLCDVRDIIQLVSLSDHELDLSLDDNVRILLDKITAIINKLDRDNLLELRALVKLRKIVQERSEYFTAVQYVVWVIQQKKQYKNQLYLEREEAKRNNSQLKKENITLTAEISEKTRLLEDIAREIRYYWLKPIVYIKAEKSYFYKQKSRKYDELNEIKSQLKDMSDRHVDDQSRWQMLQRELSEVKSDIDSIKSVTPQKKEEWKQCNDKWVEKKTFIIDLCKKHETPLILSKQDVDENNIIKKRLEEFKVIREEGLKAAERVYKFSYDNINSAYDAKMKALNEHIDSQNKLLKKKNEEIILLKKKVSEAEQDLKLYKQIDNRFILVKLVSEDSSVTKAKKLLESRRRTLKLTIEAKDMMIEQLMKFESEKVKLPSEREAELKKCKKVVLRPTSEELLEESKLELLLEDIKNDNRVKKNEDKV